MRGWISLLGLISFLSVSLAIAQTNTSVVEGRVFDASGAVIPGCSVSLVNLATSAEFAAVTNDAGFFSFPAVPVGNYRLRVEKSEFRTFELSDLRVTVGQRASIDVVLELGPVTESLTVDGSDSSPLMDTGSNELGTFIEPVNVQRLPLNGRNYLRLGYLSGAAQDGGAPSSDFLSAQTGHSDRAITIAGAQQDLIAFAVNGISVAGSRLGNLSLNVSVAAVDQFKVVQGFIMPSLGPAPGSVNVVTKSGGNSLHGEAFEFVRNNAFDARTFFEPKPRPGPFRRNQFGGALSGPLLRNRIFFFANYEGFRQSLSAPQGGFSPTRAMFGGDFSELPAPIFDPNSFSSSTSARQPFAGNVIPAARLNPVAQRLLDFYRPGASYDMRPLNFFAAPPRTQRSDQGGLRLDAILSKSHTLFGQYLHENSPVENPGLFPVSGYFYHLNTRYAMAQLTSVFGPHLVNEIRAGFTRPYLFYGGIGQPGVQRQIGLTGTADVDGVPAIQLNGFSSFGAPQSLIGNIDNNYQLHHSLRMFRGAHEISAGVNLHYVRTVQESANWNARGTLVFNSVFTAGLAPGPGGQPAPAASTGSSFADFLLGIPVSGTVTSMPRTHYRWTEFNPFLQHTWRLRSGLTLNLGLGWYLATPPNPSGNDRMYPHAFDFRTGKVLYAALGEIDPRIFSTDLNNFSPRVGFAWQPRSGGRTVVRAGAGVYYPQLRALYLLFGITAPGVAIVQSIANSPYSPHPAYLLGHNVFPPISLKPITREFADNVSGTVFALDQGLRSSYSMQWNFSVQHSLRRDMLIELAYIGSQSRKLPIRWNVNDCSSPGTLACNPSAIRWPQYSYVYFAAHAGFASYNAFNAKLQREFSGGFNLLANYTWSKALTNTQQGGANAPLNQMGSCLACDKGLAGFNVPHKLTAATVWELPFGRGKHFLAHVPPVWNNLLSGWAASVIATFSAGNPFTVNAPNNTPAPLTNFRADRLCHGRNELRNRNLRTNGLFWFDPSCFAAPQPGFFGNSGAYILTGPGVNNWDIAIDRTFSLLEDLRLQLRAEFFNAWNHAQFNSPSSMVGDANFGQVTEARNARQIQLALKLQW